MPAKAKDIRQMFRASQGYVLVGSDFSQQEPKLTAFLSQDEGLLKAARDGRDVYSSIAAIAFHTTYDNCLEFFPEGTPIKHNENGEWEICDQSVCEKFANGTTDTNYAGKNRRAQSKAIVLGICYGRGIASIAKQLGTTEQEAQNIYDSVLDIFKGLKKFDEDSKRMAFEKGYVTTIWGRRRRLPDIRLPEYSISYTAEHMAKAEQAEKAGTQKLPTELAPETIEYWAKQLESIKYRSDYKRIKDIAYAQGINIVSNQAFKARAARQTVNARVQGSAAEMSKIAMVKVAKDKRLQELGFRVLIQVHDELIGECPYENRKEVAERFAEVMSTCVLDKIDLPFSCDCDISTHWLGTSISAEDIEEYADEFEEDED